MDSIENRLVMFCETEKSIVKIRTFLKNNDETCCCILSDLISINKISVVIDEFKVFFIATDK